jgi:Zn-dependent metalloprotease
MNSPFLATLSLLFVAGTLVLAQNPQNRILSYNLSQNNIERSKILNHTQDILHLPIESQLIKKRTYTDRIGLTHDRYTQFYKNILVENSAILIHSKDNLVTNITGYFETDLQQLNTVPTIDEKTTIQLATQAFYNSVNEELQLKSILHLHPKVEDLTPCIIRSDFPNTSGEVLLAYKVILSIQKWDQPIKKVIYLDAHQGKIIKVIDKIFTHRSRGKGNSNYYGQVTFDHDSISPSEYYLRDYSRGKGIAVVNKKTNNIYQNQSPNWYFSDTDDKAAVDVMYGTQHFYDLLRDKFNYNSIDNEGYALTGKVNFFLYNNAFWDGESATFGGGDCFTYNSFTSLDVVGHEFGHGLTEFNSGLVNSGESGAINESISDIFGKTLEYFTKPNQFSWTVGDLVAKQPEEAFRSFSNPYQYYQPKMYKGKYWSYNFFETHNNNGVMNFWYYLLVNGGNNVNEKNVSYNVRPLGIEKAFEIVFLVNTLYLHGGSDYNDVFEYSKLVTENLYGQNSEEYLAVVEAWKAVGLPYIEDKNYIFAIGINEDYNYNPIECWQENMIFNYNIKNKSNVVIPKGATINATLSAKLSSTNIVILQDTLISLVDSLRPNASIDIPTHFFMPDFKETVDFRSEIKLNLSDTTFAFYNNILMHYMKEVTEPKDFYEIIKAYHFIENVCDTQSNISKTRIVLSTNFCKSYPAIFEIVYEDDVNSTKLLYQTIINPSFFFTYLQIENPDLSMFPNKKNLRMKLYQITGSEKYLIAVDTLSDNFLQPLKISEKIDFNQIDTLIDEKRILVSGGLDINRFLYNKALYMNNPYTITNQNYCAPLEEFHTYNIFENNYSIFSVINAKVCVNTENIEEPYFSFDAKLGDQNSGNSYHHAIFVKGDQQVLTKEFITDTKREFENFQFPIQKKNNLPIDFSIYINNTNATLDNIGIFDKKSTKSKDEKYHEAFVISNPAYESIRIDSKVPIQNISFYTTNGSQMYSLSTPNNSVEIDCSAWAAGFYLYRIESHDTKHFGKLIIVK